jgi:acetyl esterase/lipase
MSLPRVGWITLVALSASLTLATPAGAQKKKPTPFKLPETIEVLRDVQYGTGGGRPLKLHILRPKEKPGTPMPVIVWIHGGGWRGGHRDSGLIRLAGFAERGYLGATIEYRLSGEATFPAQIEDCKCAIRFLRAKAKDYHLDPERIGVWGSSAGGHLVALLGTSGHVKELEGKGGWENFSSKVQAVCDFCGPTDFVKIVADSDRAKEAVNRLLGGPPSEKKDLAVLASPLTHVTRDLPRFLVVHGDQDRVVPMDQSELLCEALKKAGGRVKLHVAKGQGHGLGGEELMTAVRSFFDRELKSKRNRD